MRVLVIPLLIIVFSLIPISFVSKQKLTTCIDCSLADTFDGTSLVEAALVNFVDSKRTGGGEFRTNTAPRSNIGLAADKRNNGTDDKELRLLLESSPVNLFNETTGCVLKTPSLKYVGAGIHGHVYSGVMTCPPSTVEEHVAIKISLTIVSCERGGPQNSIINGTYQYASEMSRPTQKQRLYRHLMTNSTDSTVKRFFAMPTGTVQVPRISLNQGMKIANKKRGKFARLINVTESEYQVVIAEVSPLVPQMSSPFEKGTSAYEKRRIIRDLVSIWQYLVDRHIVHCDMNHRHLLYSREWNRTILVDFELFNLMRTEVGTTNYIRRQRSQLWQVLQYIASVCAERPRLFEVSADICNRKDTFNVTERMQQLVPAFRKCPVNGEMEWREDSMTNVSQTYRDLKTWAGLGESGNV